MKIALCLAMKSCGPFKASTAAHCAMDDGLDVDCDCSFDMALISGFGRRAIADAPAGHAIGLGHAVHGEGALIERRFHLGRRRELEVVIDEMLIHVVGQHPDMRVAHQDVGHFLQFVARIGGTARIGGRVEDEPFGARRDRLLEASGLKLETMLGGGRHENRLAARQHHDIGIAHPIGRRDDDLVARIDGRHQRIEQHLLAAGADRDLRWLVVEAVLALELGR